MTNRADALVLEDNPKELEEIAGLIERSGLDTLATRSPAQAIRLLRTNDPTIAVVDWNMELSPDAERTAESVLRALAHDHPGTHTIVYATNAGRDLRLQDRIATAHPSAIPHDKRQGMDSLLRRIRTLLRRRVGDLTIDMGTVVHLPSGDVYRNKWGVRLMCAYPRSVQVERQSPPYLSIWRFGRWLDEVESNVEVASEGGGIHRLRLRTARGTRVSQRR